MQICCDVVERMIEHARQEYPLECCGLLSGENGVIHDITPTENQLESNTEFRIPPAALFDFMRNTRKDDREFLGIYHSHPRGPAEPSERDRREFFYSDVSYWIISSVSQKPRVSCFRWTRGTFVREAYVSLPSTRVGRLVRR